MGLRLLHTADWHIGQTFHEYDRTYEHEQFLSWLIQLLKEKEIDILLVSGDVFDVSNPSAASVAMFYKFLVEAVKTVPALQIVIIAGNHDSAARLEAPNPLLAYLNIRIIGAVERDQSGNIGYEKLIVPLRNKAGNIEAWCMAIPFLRPGDYPHILNATSLYIEGVNAVYAQAYEFALQKKQPGQSIIAMGHLHTMDAVIMENDRSERLIMGGIELVPTNTFNENIAYTALGHIHKSQNIGGKSSIRYSGSPIPMSFSEQNYKHRVHLIDIEDERASNIESVEIPVTTGLLRIPKEYKALNLVIEELGKLPETDPASTPAPYLEVRVLLEGPEPSLKHKIETALENKHVRLAKIDLRYRAKSQDKEENRIVDQLQDMKPLNVFSFMYQNRYKNAVPDELVELFNKVVADTETEVQN